MTRKEFLFVIWKKAIRPILFIGIIYLSIDFLYELYTDKGKALGMIILGVFSLLLIYTSAHLLNIILEFFSVKLKSILPKRLKNWLKIISELVGFFVPVLCGIAIYHLWNKDKYTAIFWLACLLIFKLFELSNKERENKQLHK